MNKAGKIKGVFFLLLAVITVCSLMMPTKVVTASSFPLSPSDDAISDALDFLRGAQQPSGSIGGFAVSAWVVMAIAAAGEDPREWGDPSIVDYLRENSDQLDWDKATDLERSILAICAAGEDPYDFGGEDYVSQLKNLYDGEQIGYDDTLNDDFWGVLALIAAGESPRSTIIENTCDFIIDNQSTVDGGWSWELYGDSDVDDTAAALMALAAADALDQETIDMALYVCFLYNQNSDGGFPFYEMGVSNSSSDSWAIGALVAVGEDPDSEYWEYGDTPVGHLLSLQNSDGSFSWTADSSDNPEWMTAYAIPALLGEPYPVTITDQQPPQTSEGVDLTVTDIDVLGTIYVDEETTVTATIKNTGDEDIDDSFRVRLYADGDTIDTATLDGLDADDDVDIDFEWTPDDAEEYELEVVADLDDDIDETSENNNDESIEVEVEEEPEEADLIVDDIDVPSAIYVDEETVVTATIKNTGDEDIDDSFRVRLYADGDTIDTATLDGLDADDDVDIDFEWTPDDAEEYELEVVADLDDDIDETSENNNDESIEVEVEGEPEEEETSEEEAPEETVAPSGSDSSQEESSPAVTSAISASIEPGNLDFGDLAPGEASAEFEIVITNTGNKDMLVTADLGGNAQDFYAATLRLDGQPWDAFSATVPQESSITILASLSVPTSYEGQIMGDGVLIFWSTPAP